MGTSNFHNVNAGNVYAVLMNYEQPVLDSEGNETDELEYHAPDIWEVDEFKQMLIENAKEHSVLNNVSFHHTCDNDPHELRNHNSLKLFQFYKQKEFGDINITVNINCVIRIGYYEGGNLDWYMTYDVGGNTIDEIDFLLDMDYYSNMSPGMIKIQCKNAEKFATKAKDELVEITEELFSKNSMSLSVVARFSNGETMYQKN